MIELTTLTKLELMNSFVNGGILSTYFPPMHLLHFILGINSQTGRKSMIMTTSLSTNLEKLCD